MRKRLTTGLAAALLLFGARVHAAICGDADGSGALAINDVVQHLRVVSAIDPAAGLCGGMGYADCANLNGDGAGTTDISDTVLLLQRVSNVRPCQADICLTEVVHPGCTASATPLPNQIHGNYVVPAGCTVRMNNFTFVNAGAVLTLGEGVTVLGTPWQSPEARLIVKPGGRLNAVGTPMQPITWTSANPPGARAKADWGGVVLLGNAPVNEPGISIEGVPDGGFGGTQGDDFSGCMSYNRLSFGGRNFQSENAFPLLLLGGVGRTTRIHHIQVHGGGGDGLQWFGGTVNLSCVVASAPGDDGFDHQLGWVGGLQFGLIAQRAEDVLFGSNGIEMDNSEFGAANPPRSDGRYCNVTAIGARSSAANPGVTNQVGVFSRRGNAMTIANTIVKDFRQAGYQMRDASTAARACLDPATLNTTSPVGVIRNSLFTDNGADGTTHPLNNSSCDAPGECACTTTEHFALLQAERAVLATTDPTVEAVGGNTFPPVNLVPPVGSLPDTHPAADCTAIHPAFVDAPYVGAFEPGGEDWTAGWADYPLN